MTLSQWLTYLERLHPSEIELGLDRIRQVADRLALDFSNQKIICIGGTNGKGSTAALLSSILQAKGKQVGCYSSPHLLHYNERVSVNSKHASDDELCQAFSLVEEARAQVQLTYFEFGTLAALVVFSKQELDYLLLEVGLGGRLDAVNILEPDLSIVTNVALDHTDWLGDTREAIGHEKAGIYRANRPAIYGETDMPESVLETVEHLSATLYHHGEHYGWSSDGLNTWQWQGVNSKGESLELNNLPTNFTLNNSIDNLASVIQAAVLLLDSNISEQDIIKGLDCASLPGRFQQLPRAKGHTLVLDVAHNPHAAENLLSNVQAAFPDKNIKILVAMLEDKDSHQFLEILSPLVSHWYVSEIKEDRGSPVKILYNHLQKLGATKVSCFDEIKDAFSAAEQEANSSDVLLVTGSFFTVATVLELV